MKKSIKLISVVLAALMLCFALASCGKKLSGTYSAEIDIVLVKYTATYEFSGSKVTATKETEGGITGAVNSVTFEGEYEIEDDKITFTWDTEDDDGVIKGGTFKFEKTDDGIKIGTVEYKKQ